MVSFVKSVTFDCADVVRLAASGTAAPGSDGDVVVLADPEGNEFCVES